MEVRGAPESSIYEHSIGIISITEIYLHMYSVYVI